MEKDDKSIDIEINSEDLKDVDAQKSNGDVLSINTEDLTEETEKIYPGLSRQSPRDKTFYKNFTEKKITALSLNILSYSSLAGLVGGIISWLITEPTVSKYGYIGLNPWRLALDTMIFSALSGGIIGFCLAGVEGFICGIKKKALDDGLYGFLVGFLGGAVGGFLGELIFSSFGITYRMIGISRFLLRGIGWSIMGLFIGISMGINMPTTEKVKNGIIGGALGGFLGGILFQITQLVVENSLSSRFLALSATGISIGFFLGLIETLRKEAWLKVVKGKLIGKEFILYTSQTIIGSNPKKCQIILFKDSQVSPIHAVISVINGNYIIADCNSQTGTYVNRQRIERCSLKNGDLIQIGSTLFEFKERLRKSK